MFQKTGYPVLRIFGSQRVNTQYLADWIVIKAPKQQLIHKNSIIENSKHIPHQYKMGDMVMLENHCANKYEQPYKGCSLPCYAS